MAVPTGTKGLRCTYNAHPYAEDRHPLTTMESKHRQSVSEHMKSFVVLNNKEPLKLLTQKQERVTFPPTTMKEPKKPSGATLSSGSNCFCGKRHAGNGRRDCQWFC